MRACLGFSLLGLILFPTLANAVCPVEHATSIGGLHWERISDAALDPSGRLVIAGEYSSSSLAIPGLPQVPNGGGQDAFLAVFEPSGNPVWAKGFGLNNAQLGLAVDSDVSGNIVLAGVLFGSVDFGGGVLSTGGSDIYLAKFDSSGNHLWSQLVGLDDYEWVYGVATALNGDIVLLTDRSSNPTSLDIYVARFDANGTLLQGQLFGTNQDDYPGDVSVTAAGDVILTGSFGASAEIGPFTTSHIGYQDAFVAKIDATGTVQWVTTWGGTQDELSNAISVAPDGSIYFGGDFSSADAPGLTGGPHQGGEDWFLGKLSANGNLEWIRNGGDQSRDILLGIDASADGDAVITGYTRDIHSDDEHVFVARFTSSNQEVFETVFHDIVGGNDHGTDVVVDASDDMIVVGNYEGTLNLCSEVLTSEGEDDGFIMRMHVPEAVAAPVPGLPSMLAQNHPNPFNPLTTIRYRLAEPGAVRIDIFDAAGRRVRRLVDGSSSAGEFSVDWNGHDDADHELSSGVYMYRLESDGVLETRRMVLVR